MMKINLSSDLKIRLPATYDLLADHLVLHPSVVQVCLTGSRGLAGCSRPDSDIDLTLIVLPEAGLVREDLAELCEQVLAASQDNWDGPVELDMAVVFDVRGCGLTCLSGETAAENTCRIGGVDCFGLYKTQRGFSGFVENAGVQVNRIYPNMVVYHRD